MDNAHDYCANAFCYSFIILRYGNDIAFNLNVIHLSCIAIVSRLIWVCELINANYIIDTSACFMPDSLVMSEAVLATSRQETFKYFDL